jgi:hypothetical protein
VSLNFTHFTPNDPQSLVRRAIVRAWIKADKSLGGWLRENHPRFQPNLNVHVRDYAVTVVNLLFEKDWFRPGFCMAELSAAQQALLVDDLSFLTMTTTGSNGETSGPRKHRPCVELSFKTLSMSVRFVKCIIDEERTGMSLWIDTQTGRCFMVAHVQSKSW